MPRSTRPAAVGALLSLAATHLGTACAHGPQPAVSAESALSEEPALKLRDAQARYDPALDCLVFELETLGDAASVVPAPAGQVAGAPVLGYVLPTTLEPAQVGFDAVEGTVALAVTSHPDFDDTPLWDEDGNDAHDDDGAVYHAHWVVLGPDERAPAGMAVLQRRADSVLPPTAPMDMYLDSPGFTVIEEAAYLRVLVPLDRVQRNADFRFGALTALMRVQGDDSPLLAVHQVLDALEDGEASRPIESAHEAPASAWPAAGDASDALDVVDASGRLERGLGTFVLSVEVAGVAATEVPSPAGSIDGAPVVGYVFPTDLDPAAVGFPEASGSLALAVTSHPDFDDTPLWDEDLDRDYENDGQTYHVHWVVLVEDEDSPAGLSVPSEPDSSRLPPTAPMPMLLDSPGFHAFASAGTLRVLVPAWHLRGVTGFRFDALTARMRVDASSQFPTLRVEEVVSALGTDGTLPRSVESL